MNLFQNAETWAGISLLCFMGLLFFLKVPKKIIQLLDDKRNAIQKELHDARVLKEEAKRLLASCQRKSKQANQEAQAILDDAKRQAEAFQKSMNQQLLAHERHLEEVTKARFALLREAQIKHLQEEIIASVEKSVLQTSLEPQMLKAFLKTVLPRESEKHKG